MENKSSRNQKGKNSPFLKDLEELRRLGKEVQSNPNWNKRKLHHIEHITANQFDDIDFGHSCIRYLNQKQKWRNLQALSKSLERLRAKSECQRGYPHICEKVPADCDLMIKWEDVLEEFGVDENDMR